jgi:hypothetical protein
MLVRVAAAAVFAAEAAFVALLVPAMRAYPGGTSWNAIARGHDFWLNYLCDLTRQVALDGEPNPGAAVAQAAMTVLAMGLLPLWWLLPHLFPSRARLGWTVRLLGSIAAIGAVAVVLMPADRFGHADAIVLAGLPGLAAVLLAVFALARDEQTPRVAAALGAATLLAASVDLVLYLAYLGGAGSILTPVLQRISTILLMAWMGTVAWLNLTAGRARRPAPSA